VLCADLARPNRHFLCERDPGARLHRKDALVKTIADVTVSGLRPAPRNPLPYRQQAGAIRAFHTGAKRCVTPVDR
jgi:hypothetical protein